MRFQLFAAACVALSLAACSSSNEDVGRNPDLLDNGAPPPPVSTGPEAALIGDWIADEGALASPGLRSTLSFDTSGNLTAVHPNISDTPQRASYSVTGSTLVVSPASALSPGVDSPDPNHYAVSADGRLHISFPMYGNTAFRRALPSDAPKADSVWARHVVGSWRALGNCLPQSHPDAVRSVEIEAGGTIRVERGRGTDVGTYTINDGKLVTSPAELLSPGSEARNEGVLEARSETSLSVTWIETTCTSSSFERR